MIKKIKALVSTSPRARLTILDQIGVSGSNFLTGILITRLVGLEAYGNFALGWMGLLFVSGLQHAFILNPMMSLGPKKEASQQLSYYTASQWLQVGFQLIAAIIVSVFVWFSDRWFAGWQVGFLFPILPIAILAFCMQEYYRRYFFIQQKVLYALIIDMIAYGGLIGGILWLNFWDILTVRAVYAMVGGSFLLGAFVGLLLARISMVFSAILIMQASSAHWRFSSWLIGTALLQFFSSNFFLLAAAAILGPIGLGALRMAQNLMGITHILFQAMENTVPVQAATALSKDGHSGMMAYLKAVSLKAGLIVGIILFMVALFATPLITWVYGVEYECYSYVLRGYCVFYLFLFPTYPLRYLLRTIEFTRPVFSSYVLSTIFSLLLAYPMVEHWGLMGVVYGLVATQIIMQLWYVWQINRRLNLRFGVK